MNRQEVILNKIRAKLQATEELLNPEIVALLSEKAKKLE